MGVIAMSIFVANGNGTLDQLPSWLAFMRPAADAPKVHVASWIIVTCALVMAAGTASGGWRIIKTLGHKLTKLHPINGFAADTASATVLITAAHLGMPVSTTHAISSAIMGVGYAKNPNGVKWSIIQRIIWAWILTLPAAAGVAYALVKVAKAQGWAG
jgi:PiT family inorganic phosphate transporter